MRNLLWGIIGIGIGLVILGGHFFSGGGIGKGAFGAGQVLGLLMGAAFLILGIIYVGGQLYYMRDELGLVSPQTRRRRRPGGQRSPQHERPTDPKQDARREKQQRELEGRLRDRERSTPDTTTVPIIIAGVVIVGVIVVLAIGGAVWYVLSPLKTPVSQRNAAQQSNWSTDPRDVPALIADLERDPMTSGMAKDAIIALGPKGEPDMIRCLTHTNLQVRSKAAEVLEKVGTSACLMPLCRAADAHQGAFGTFEGAARTIKERERKAGRSPKLPPSSEEARNVAANLKGDHGEAESAMKTLRAMGSPAEGAVLAYIEDSDFNARHRAAQVMQDIGTVAGLDLLRLAK